MEETSLHYQPGTPVGQVLEVRGSEANISLPAPWPDNETRATVGKCLAIAAGRRSIIGMITEVTARQSMAEGTKNNQAVARVSLMGEITTGADGKQAFRRGVSEYPAIGDAASIISSEQLRLIYAPAGKRTIDIGELNHDNTIAASIDVDNLISKHFAVLGSTGVGKSSGVTVILREIVKARPDVRVLLLDGHNEYGSSFGQLANVIGPRSLKLPFWLFNFEELTDVVFGGRPAIAEELEILSELIPLAKNQYLQYKSATDRLAIKKIDPKRTGYTVDTPVPYLLQDLMALIDERMGKLENRSVRMNYHRLMMRIETIKNDSRYAFMFENASVGGDTMASILSHLFRLEPDGQPISIMQLAGLPVEVVDAVVCVVCRLAFDFGLWSDGAMPLLFVCEEAHRFASADRSVGFGPTRRAISRIAKEGRKYGVFLGLVTQRPAELDPTIISRCSTLFAMRMANDHDQALLRSAVADAAANLLDFVPSLGTGEVVGFGEGMPMPARLTFSRLEADSIPQSEAAVSFNAEVAMENDQDFVRSVVQRWRGMNREAEAAMTAGYAEPAPQTYQAGEPPRPAYVPPPAPPARPSYASQPQATAPQRQTGESISRLLQDARQQILKR